MQTAVVQGMAVPPGIAPVDMVKGKLQKAIAANDIPSDAVVQVKPGNNTVLGARFLLEKNCGSAFRYLHLQL
jgi:hypothetical protein